MWCGWPGPSWDVTRLNDIRPILASAALATMRRSHREHCTHSTLIVHLLSSKERSCSLDSRNLGYNNKPHIRPAQSRRLFKGTVGCTFSPLNEAPTLPLRYILETDAAGCDAQLSSVHCVFLFLSFFENQGPDVQMQGEKKTTTREPVIGWGSYQTPISVCNICILEPCFLKEGI